MAQPIVVGKRRFTCLSPTLVRLEYAPDGIFDSRLSVVAAEKKRAVHFEKRNRKDDTLVMETGGMTIVSRGTDTEFAATNLEIRWVQDGLLQYWRPGDRDHFNLGGTVRSLDRYGHSARMQGVHTADMQPPDAKALPWLAWLQCEDDPPYYAASPRKREGTNSGDWHAFADRGNSDGRLLERTLNWTADAHRYSVGVLSTSGYFFLNDSTSAVLDEDGFPVERNRPGYQDWYFFAYGHDYRAALHDFVLLAGRAPLPTRNSFGLIFSRWPAYDETEARDIVQRFGSEGYPLSTLVLDMEWHKEGWGNWDWNEALYADPAAFFRWCHRKGIEVTLNDHPLDVRSDDSHFKAYVKAAGPRVQVQERQYNKKTLPMASVNICDKREAHAFLETCHSHIIEQGLDFWWNDGCRGELAGSTGQLVINKLLFEEVERKGKRGMLLARYGGLGSHRYGVFFTGDTESCWNILALQCEFNVRAGHIGLAYVSHDIGGFFTRRKTDLINHELYLRWLQFGVFNPVMRFHSAPNAGSRQPWDYDGLCRGNARRWLRLRNRLLPYIYSAAREHHDSGVPIVRGMFLDHPSNKDCYRFDQYFFGPSLLVAPVLSAERKRRLYLPPGMWWKWTGTAVESITKPALTPVKGGRELSTSVPLRDVPVYVKAGTVLPYQDADAPLHEAHINTLHLDVYPGADGRAVLYEDDGRSPRYRKGTCCKTKFTLSDDGKQLVLSGRVVEGKPFGRTRSVVVHVLLDRKPSHVRLRRGRTGRLDVSEQQDGGWYHIALPEAPADQAFELTITR